MMTVRSMTMTAMTAIIMMSADALYLSHTARMLVCLLQNVYKEQINIKKTLKHE